MYEEWENLTHQGVSFTILYRQQIYEIHSEIITTLIDCFSELNKTHEVTSRNRVGVSPGENVSTSPTTHGSSNT